MSQVWRINRNKGKKSGQARPELFPLLPENPMDLAFHHFLFPPWQLCSEQAGLLQRATVIT